MNQSRITLKKEPLIVTGTAKQKAEITMVNLAGHARSQMHYITQDVKEVKNVLKDEACGLAMSAYRMLSDDYS